MKTIKAVVHEGHLCKVNELTLTKCFVQAFTGQKHTLDRDSCTIEQVPVQVWNVLVKGEKLRQKKQFEKVLREELGERFYEMLQTAKF